MSTNDFASCSDAGNRSGELGGVTKTGSGGTPELGSGSGDEREHENSSDSRTELAADVSSRNEDKGEGRAERYGDARHSDGLLSPIVLGHQLAGQDLASGNVSATFEPVLHSEVLSSQHRGVNSAIETKVRSGSGLFSSQRLASSTTKVEAKLSAPLPPESRLEGAFESSASLFEAIKESSGAIKESSGAVIESPKRVIGKPEDGQPGLNGDHGDRSTPTKTLKKARGVELELNRAAFTPLGCIGPRQRHENHLSGGSLKTPSLKSGPVQGLEYESAGPTSAEHRVHLSGMAKADAAAVMKYLSKPSRDAGSSHTLSSHDNQSRATPDDGPAINGPVTTTLHEYNAQNIANDIERYRMAGFPYPGPEYFSLAPPSGPFHTRPYQREAGVYCREFNGRGPRSRRSTQGQSQRSPPVIGGVASFEEVSGPSFMFSPESPASPVPRPFHGEAERYRAQFVGRQLNSRRPAQGQSPRSPPIVQAFNGSRDGIDARISSLSAESPTLEALRPFHIEAAGHRSGQPRMSKASRYRGKSQSNQSCVGDDTRPKLPTQEAPLSSTQQQPQQQQPQAGAPSATQTQLNITRTCLIEVITRLDQASNVSIGLSMPPATLPAINASAATYAAPHADNMGLTFVPLLSESYLQQLRMMHTTGGQIPLANAPPSQTEKTSSGLYLHSEHPILLISTANTRCLDLSIRHLARPIQAQTPDARVPRALHFAQGSFITMHAKSSQSQLAKAPSTQAQNASSGQNTHSEHSLSLLNMADAPFEPPSNPHQTHLASARALIARLPSALPSTQGPSSTINPRGLQSQFAEEPSTQARNASSGQNTYSDHSSSLLNTANAPLQLQANLTEPMSMTLEHLRRVSQELSLWLFHLRKAHLHNSRKCTIRLPVRELAANTPRCCLTWRTLRQIHPTSSSAARITLRQMAHASQTLLHLRKIHLHDFNRRDTSHSHSLPAQSCQAPLHRIHGTTAALHLLSRTQPTSTILPLSSPSTSATSRTSSAQKLQCL